MNQTVVELDKVTKSYSKTNVLDQLSGQIKQGQILGLVGRNGAGKTTLLESVMGLKTIDSGKISIWNHQIGELNEQQKQRIGFVPQDSIGFEWMKVADYLNYFGGFFDNWDQTYSQQLVSRWKIDKKQRISDLSGGQQQILQVIQALSIKPKLLILDEPVAHLDPNMRRQFLAELVDLTCELGTTVIFSTHIISDLERVASHIALLENGRIEYFCELEELKQYTAQLIFKSSPRDKSVYPELINWSQSGNGGTAVLALPNPQVIKNLEQEIGSEVTIMPISLEDWYLEVTHETNA
jgi:ABC-2 type transport system ATP-binding protein